MKAEHAYKNVLGAIAEFVGGCVTELSENHRDTQVNQVGNRFRIKRTIARVPIEVYLTVEFHPIRDFVSDDGITYEECEIVPTLDFPRYDDLSVLDAMTRVTLMADAVKIAGKVAFQFGHRRAFRERF